MEINCVLIKNKFSGDHIVLKNLSTEIVTKNSMKAFKAETINVTQKDIECINNSFKKLGLNFDIEDVMKAGDLVYLMTIFGVSEGRIEYLLSQDSKRLKEIANLLDEGETLEDVFHVFNSEESKVVSEYLYHSIQKNIEDCSL